MANRRVALVLTAIVLGCSACDDPPSDGAAFQLEDTEDSVGVEPPEYWAARLDSRSSTVRREALGSLGEAGGAASRYAPRVVPLLADPDERTGFTAAWALAHMGTDAHPLLISRLESRDPRVRERAAYGIGEMGAAGAIAIDSLKSLSTDRDPAVRSMASWALGEVLAARMVADPNMVMTEGLDGTQLQRLQAVDRLGARTPNSRIAVRMLIYLMGDSVPAIRARAIEALAEAGPSALPSLSAALSHRNSFIRRGALVAISRMHRPF